MVNTIASVHDVMPVTVVVPRRPEHGQPGNWERAADTARVAGAEVLIGDWDNEPALRRASLAHLADKGVTHAVATHHAVEMRPMSCES